MDLRPAAAAALFLALCAQRGIAEQRTATLGVSARVIRSCAVQSGTATGTPVRLTCSRDATPGVVTGASSAVTTPVLPMRTTSIQPIEMTTSGGLRAAFTPGVLGPVQAQPSAAAPAPIETPAALPATAQSPGRVATPVATTAEPVGMPATTSRPGRQVERQIVTINF